MDAAPVNMHLLVRGFPTINPIMKTHLVDFPYESLFLRMMHCSMQAGFLDELQTHLHRDKPRSIHVLPEIAGIRRVQSIREFL